MPTVWPARPCKACGRRFTPTRHNGVYCSKTCIPSRYRKSYTNTTQRGLGSEHQKTRRRLLPYAYGQPCPLAIPDVCLGIMRKGIPLHLDHTLPRSLGGTRGDRIVCGPCNQSRGNGTHKARTPTPDRTSSRTW